MADRLEDGSVLAAGDILGWVPVLRPMLTPVRFLFGGGEAELVLEKDRRGFGGDLFARGKETGGHGG